MAVELKCRIHDPAAVEAALLRRGAVFREERVIVDTYFHQPIPHEVLKIQRDQHRDWLVHLKPKDGGFDIVQFAQIHDADAQLARLTALHGVRSVLRKRCRFFAWDPYVIDLNLIEDYGDFLVLTGEAPPPTEAVMAALLADLGVAPEMIRVPFNELPRR